MLRARRRDRHDAGVALHEAGGRQRGLIRGTLWGVVGALICVAAIWAQSFWPLCFGRLLRRVQRARPVLPLRRRGCRAGDFRATATSLVLAGGLVGGIIGPTTSRWTIDASHAEIHGRVPVLIAFAIATMLLLRYIRIPTPRASASARRRAAAARDRFAAEVIVAVAAGAIGYGVMNFLMTSTPIAMQVCGHPYRDAAFVISSHIIGMFAPSFVTDPSSSASACRPSCSPARLSISWRSASRFGIAVAQFWWSLVVIGVGWNFLYIGGTTLLTETYRYEERARAQGLNEQAIFTMMAISSFSSGMTVTAAGWERVNLFALPLVAAVAIAIVWYAFRQRAERAAAA